MVSNAYLELAKQRNVKIVQKHLVAGHIQMEVDSMHAYIKSRIISNIMMPRDYIVLMETARLYPAPYIVQHVCYKDFRKLNESCIRPGKKSGDPTVYDLRALEYISNREIRF